MSDNAPSLSYDSSPIIGETYRVESGVARGGFSTIYQARHIEMDRPVALKIVEVDEGVDAAVLERFSQEARLTCAINHPNVITIYEFGQDDRGLLFLAMEWLEGMSLNTRLEQSGALDVSQVTRFGKQIAEGLAAAHSHDILHRDLKPSNIMLTRPPAGDEYAKILDFGIATPLDPPIEDQLQITQEGMFVGTPRYAAPEQIQGGELTPRTDVYGTGLLLWEALVGKPAVPSVDFGECCSYHLSDDPWNLPSGLDCPPELVETIERCLQKNPEHRFESCIELSKILNRLDRDLGYDRGLSPDSAEPSSSLPGQFTQLLFGGLVAAAVIVLLGYPLFFSLEYTPSPEALPVSASEATTVSSPEMLAGHLEELGWQVQDTPLSDSSGASSLYRLTVEPDSRAVRPSSTPSDETGGDGRNILVQFPSFRVEVTSDSNDRGAMFYRLTGDLFALQEAASRAND